MKRSQEKAMYAKRDFFVSSNIPKVSEGVRIYHRVTAWSENDARKIFTKHSRESASSPKIILPSEVKPKFRKYSILGNPKVQLK